MGGNARMTRYVYMHRFQSAIVCNHGVPWPTRASDDNLIPTRCKLSVKFLSPV